jgi:hypothetical protein
MSGVAANCAVVGAIRSAELTTKPCDRPLGLLPELGVADMSKRFIFLAVLLLACWGCATPPPKGPDVSFEERLLATIPKGAYADSVVFAPNGRQVGYVDYAGDRVLVGNTRWPAFDHVYGPVFSPDGSRAACVANSGGKLEPFGSIVGGRWFAVLDGMTSEGYDDVDHIVFSPDSKHVAYVANEGGTRHGGMEFTFVEGGRSFVVVDGVKGEEFDEMARYPRFVPGTGEVVYAARRGDKEFMVIGNRISEPYDEVYRLQFTPDGRQVAYVARQREKHLGRKGVWWRISCMTQARRSSSMT